MHTTYDPRFRHNVTYIYAGECCVGGNEDVIGTVLGSCVAICLFDRVNEIGGMIHFMLPEIHNTTNLDNPLLYGDESVKYLINMLKNKATDKGELVAKIFGGANISQAAPISSDVGSTNIKFAKEVLKKRGITILKEDVGGNFPIKIFFMPRLNRVLFKRVK